MGEPRGTVLPAQLHDGHDGSSVNRVLARAGIWASGLDRPTASLEEAFLDLVER